jgi:hypothetical protein
MHDMPVRVVVSRSPSWPGRATPPRRGSGADARQKGRTAARAPSLAALDARGGLLLAQATGNEGSSSDASYLLLVQWLSPPGFRELSAL